MFVAGTKTRGPFEIEEIKRDNYILYLLGLGYFSNWAMKFWK